MHGFISGFSVLVPLVYILFLCQHQVALPFNLKSGILIPPAPFFFPKTALATRGPLCFHMKFCSTSVGKKNVFSNLMRITLNL